MLDVAAANVGSARAVADLLAAVWSTAWHTRRCASGSGTRWDVSSPAAASSPVLTDAVRVASKTGSFLHLRHDAGVVEHGDQQVVVVALTESRVPVAVDPGADAAIGWAARRAFEALRR